MRPTATTSAAAPPGSPAATGPSRPNSAAGKRQRKLAAAPLGDVTNILPLLETPAQTKPRRTARRSLPTPAPAPTSASAASSTCSSTASVTPAPAPSSAAVLDAQEERDVFGSPAISTVYARRGATTGAGAARRNPAAARSTAPSKDKGKAPADAAGTASCPPLGKAARKSTMAQEEEHTVFGSPAISTVYASPGATTGAGAVRRNPATRSTAPSKGKGKAPADAAGTASCPPLGKAERKSTMAHATRPVSSSAPCHEAKKKKKRLCSGMPKLPEDFVKKQRAYFAEVDAFELPVEEVSESDLE